MRQERDDKKSKKEEKEDQEKDEKARREGLGTHPMSTSDTVPLS